MAFITSRNPLAGREIDVNVYDENGKLKEIKFVAQYKRKKRTEYRDLVKQLTQIGMPVLDDAGKATDAIHQAPFETDTIFLQTVMGGWVGVERADGTAREFSADELQDLLEEWPELIPALADGFHQVHAAAPAPRAKNS